MGDCLPLHYASSYVYVHAMCCLNCGNLPAPGLTGCGIWDHENADVCCVTWQGPGDDVSAGAFSVRQSREGGGLLALGEEEGSGGKGPEEEEGYRRRDEEAGQWLRQALRDASPMGLEGEGFMPDAKVCGRQSFSATFFKAKGGMALGTADDEEQQRPPQVCLGNAWPRDGDWHLCDWA